jgi:hypothetical protein
MRISPSIRIHFRCMVEGQEKSRNSETATCLPGIRDVAHLEGGSSNSRGSEGVIKGESKRLVSSRDLRKSGNISPYIREGDRWTSGKGRTSVLSLTTRAYISTMAVMAE